MPVVTATINIEFDDGDNFEFAIPPAGGQVMVKVTKKDTQLPIFEKALPDKAIDLMRTALYALEMSQEF